MTTQEPRFLRLKEGRSRKECALMGFVAILVAVAVAIPQLAFAQTYRPRRTSDDIATVPPQAHKRRRTNPVPPHLRIAGVPEPTSDKEAAYLYRRHRKIVGLALALELILPSAGLIYTRRYPETAFYWAGFATGMLLILTGIGDAKNEPHVPRLVAGSAALIVFRFGAMVWAPMAAHRHNKTLAAQLGVDRWGRPVGTSRSKLNYRPRLAPSPSQPEPSLPPMAQPQSRGILVPIMRFEF